jgi:hypothetical protein
VHPVVLRFWSRPARVEVGLLFDGGGLGKHQLDELAEVERPDVAVGKPLLEGGTDRLRRRTVLEEGDERGFVGDLSAGAGELADGGFVGGSRFAEIAGGLPQPFLLVLRG